jgi:hypothetical protein
MKIQNWVIIGMNNLSRTILSLEVRGWWATTTEFDQAEKALNRGDKVAAVLHFEKVVLWDFPLFGYREKAISRMEMIKQKAHVGKNTILERYAQDALAFASASADGLHRGRGSWQQLGASLPNHFWSWMVGVSLIAWIGITFYFIWFSFDKNMSLVHKKGFIVTFSILLLLVFFWIYSIQQL